MHACMHMLLRIHVCIIPMSAGPQFVLARRPFFTRGSIQQQCLRFVAFTSVRRLDDEVPCAVAPVERKGASQQ